MRHALAAIFCAAFVLSGAASAQQPTTVMLGVSGRPDQADLQLALDRGYFAAQGLDIKTVQASSGMEFVSSLATDQLQVASGSPNAGLFNALNRGIDIRIVADFAHFGDAKDRTLSLIARADLVDGGIVKGPADLKGRSIAFGPAGLGQVTDVLYDKIFAPLGIGRDAMQIEHINFPDIIAAFASKAIDSAFEVEPFVTVAEQRNVARVVVPGGAAYPGGELSVVYYSAAFAKNEDAATRFMVAYLKGVRDYYDAFFLGKDRDATIGELVKSLPLKDPRLWAKSRQFTDLNGKVNVADLKYQAEFYRKIGALSGPVPDIDRYVDPRFATAAVKVLGAR
jgi:NitT/TauT family transport system substrate-binding protein